MGRTARARRRCRASVAWTVAVSWPSRPCQRWQQVGHVVEADHDAGGAEHLVGHRAIERRGLDDLGRGREVAGLGTLGDDADAVASRRVAVPER